MTRPVTLFTGQWADLPLADIAEARRSSGMTGWSWRAGGIISSLAGALADAGYAKTRWDVLERHGLTCFAVVESSGGAGGVRPD